VNADARFPGSLGATALQLAGQGQRCLLVTSALPGEGKTRIVAEMGRDLTADQAVSAILVDANPHHAALHEAFGLPRGRGLYELLDEVYGMDLAREDPDQFGLGDFLEILRAQRKSGELVVEGEGQHYAIDLAQGSIQSIAADVAGEERRVGELLVAAGRTSERDRDEALRIHHESGRRLGEVLTNLGRVQPAELAEALKEQASARLAQLLALRQPQCRFLERAEPLLPAAGGRAMAAGETSALDAFLFDRLNAYLRQPFLGSQIPSYFTDTPARNLKLLTAGHAAHEVLAPRQAPALKLLIARLRRLFDLVIIDAPAVDRSAVTTTLAELVDGVVLVVKTDVAPAQDVRRAAETLKRGGANVLGVLINQRNGSTREAAPVGLEVGRGTASPY